MAHIEETAPGHGRMSRPLSMRQSVAAAREDQPVVIPWQVITCACRALGSIGLRPFAAIETVHLIDRDLLQALGRLASRSDDY